MRRLVFLVAVIVTTIACNNNNDGKTGAVDTTTPKALIPSTPDKPGSSQQAPATNQPADSVVHEKIAHIIDTLLEVQKLRAEIPARSTLNLSFGYMVTEPGNEEQDYVVQLGFNSSDRFESRYIIHITPQSWQVKFLDVVTDSLFTVEDFRRLKR